MVTSRDQGDSPPARVWLDQRSSPATPLASKPGSSRLSDGVAETGRSELGQLRTIYVQDDIERPAQIRPARSVNTGDKLRAGPEPLTVYCYSCGPLFVGRTLPKLATNDVHHTSPRRSVIERELRGDEIAKAMRGARS